MDMKELKIKEIARLKRIMDDNKDRAIPITYCGITLYVLYVEMYLHRSVLYKSNRGATYVLIKSELSNEEKQKELHLLLKDKKLHYFDDKDKEKIEDEIEVQRKKEVKKLAKEVLTSVINDYIERFGESDFEDTFKSIMGKAS